MFDLRAHRVPSIRTFGAAAAAACLMALGGTAQAAPVAWSWVSGPGTLSSSQVGNVATLTEANSSSPFGFNTWIVGATVADAGDYTFDFRLNGFFAFFAVTLQLFAEDSSGNTQILNEGPESCGSCLPPSGGFDYSGSYTFTGLSAGESIRFRWVGRNGDINRTMNSTLTLTERMAVPSPATGALVGLALLAAGAGMRRKA